MAHFIKATLKAKKVDLPDHLDVAPHGLMNDGLASECVTTLLCYSSRIIKGFLICSLLDLDVSR